MTNNLQIAILEAAHDGLLENHEAISLINYTYEGVNLDAHKEYRERNKAARALVGQYRAAKKAGKFKEADACLDKAIKILDDLQDSLKDYQEMGGFVSFVFSLFVPTLKDFIPLYGTNSSVINNFNVWIKAFKKAATSKEGANVGDLNKYISRLNYYTNDFKKYLVRQKAELRKYKETIAKESVDEDVSLDDILAEITDLI